MIDRQTPPAFHKLEEVKLPEVKEVILSNGRKVFYLNDSNTQVFKIDLVIKAGSWYSDNYPAVSMTLQMLSEGTKTLTARELANSYDELGSFTDFTPGFDNSTISVYGLSKYFEENMAVLADMISSPAFDTNSFESLRARQAQKQRLNLEKSNYRASLNFRVNLFGNSHAYGVRPSVEAIESLELAACIRLFENNYSDFDIHISGNLPQSFTASLEKFFGKSSVNHASQRSIPISEHTPENLIAERDPKFIQSSIRMGRKLFTRAHEDYMSFILLNEAFGGYFGSRLMKNIREDKGFTYGIYSQLLALNQDGYLSIGTDVNTENENETIDEIYKEIETLRTELINQEELATVKNYLSGAFAGSISSSFSVMDKFKAVYYQGMNLSFFQNYIQTIESTDSSELLAKAHKYLDPAGLSLSVVGK